MSWIKVGKTAWGHSDKRYIVKFNYGSGVGIMYHAYKNYEACAVPVADYQSFKRLKDAKAHTW